MPNVFPYTADKIEANVNKVSSIENSKNPEVEYPNVQAVKDALSNELEKLIAWAVEHGYQP